MAKAAAYCCKDEADDDPIVSAAAKAEVVGGCIGGRALLCGSVRPSAVAVRMGPVLGDLGGLYPHVAASELTSTTSDEAFIGPTGAALRSLFPTALPLALLVAALVVKALDACEHMPLVAAVFVALYAAFVAAVRPFTGHSHSAFEALWSAVAAVLLIWLWVAFRDGDKEEWDLANAAAAGNRISWAQAFTASERGAATCLGGLLSCRYPFVLARALGVGVPRVVATRRGSRQRCDDDDDASKLEAPLINACDPSDVSDSEVAVPPLAELPSEATTPTATVGAAVVNQNSPSTSADESRMLSDSPPLSVGSDSDSLGE